MENIKTLICCSNRGETNEADRKACTALHYLAKMKSANKKFLKDMTKVGLKHFGEKLNTFSIKLLLSRGANATLEDNEGFNPRDRAKDEGNLTVQKVLEDALAENYPDPIEGKV